MLMGMGTDMVEVEVKVEVEVEVEKEKEKEKWVVVWMNYLGLIRLCQAIENPCQGSKLGLAVLLHPQRKGHPLNLHLKVGNQTYSRPTLKEVHMIILFDNSLLFSIDGMDFMVQCKKKKKT
jgi:hypothetical protein